MLPVLAEIIPVTLADSSKYVRSAVGARGSPSGRWGPLAGSRADSLPLRPAWVRADATVQTGAATVLLEEGPKRDLGRHWRTHVAGDHNWPLRCPPCALFDTGVVRSSIMADDELERAWALPCDATPLRPLT
jgi:hypothetical protein